MPTRKIAKLSSSKPAAATPAKPVAAAAKPATPAVVAAPTEAKSPAHINRTASTVVKQRTNFGEISDRDGFYFGQYKRLAQSNGGAFTIADIVAKHGTHFSGAPFASAKAHDAGVLVRLGKAGLISHASDGHRFTLTKLGNERKA